MNAERTKPNPQKDWARECEKIKQILLECPRSTKRLCQYFEYRGLHANVPKMLRLHPLLAYYHTNGEVTYHPTMVAQISKGCEVVGLHKTYLSFGGGKANVPCPKKTIKCADTISGGSIKLFVPESGRPLVLCEGIETALAIHEYSGWPVWSCVNSTMLEKVQLPESIKSVIICADKDKTGAGEKAAEKLAQRLIDEGRKVEISFPPLEIPGGEKSVDWLDFLNSMKVAHV